MFFKRRTDEPLTLGEKLRQVFSNAPELSSDRLLYKKIVPENSLDMYEYSRLEEVTRYLLWTPHVSLTQTQRYIKLLQKKYESGAFWDFGLTEAKSGKFIGTCGVTSFDEKENSIEIGYVLSPDFWGAGLATEAARTVMRFCFENFGVDRITGKFMEGNNASMRVMTKLGMTLEGIYRNSMFVKGEYKTIHVYEVTREKFNSLFGNKDTDIS